MDLSKLPKMGAGKADDAVDPAAPASSAESSAESSATSPDTSSVASPAPSPVTPYATPAAQPILMGDLATEAAVAGALGLIFLMLSGSFGGWLMATLRGRPFETYVNWTSGPQTGTPVAYFDLQGGTAWLQMGLWVLGTCLILEALLACVGLLRRKFGPVLTTACLLLGLIAAAANGVAIVMQIQAGFTQPIFSIIALAIGTITSILHGRRILT